MITRKGAVTIYVIALIGVISLSLLSWMIGYDGLVYLELDVEHNYIPGYGIGLGSLSHCARLIGLGVTGLIVSISSMWIFPMWLRIKKFWEAE